MLVLVAENFCARDFLVHVKRVGLLEAKLVGNAVETTLKNFSARDFLIKGYREGKERLLTVEMCRVVMVLALVLLMFH